MQSKLLSILAVGTFACFMAESAHAANSTGKKTTDSAKSMRSSWPSENISGTIAQVNPERKLLIVKDADGVPFDIEVTAATRIEQDGRRVQWDQLKSDLSRKVTVDVKPERRGDMAETVHISG